MAFHQSGGQLFFYFLPELFYFRLMHAKRKKNRKFKMQSWLQTEQVSVMSKSNPFLPKKRKLWRKIWLISLNSFSVSFLAHQYTVYMQVACAKKRERAERLIQCTSIYLLRAYLSKEEREANAIWEAKRASLKFVEIFLFWRNSKYQQWRSQSSKQAQRCIHIRIYSYVIISHFFTVLPTHFLNRLCETGCGWVGGMNNKVRGGWDRSGDKMF